jgi:hypothetical protein
MAAGNGLVSEVGKMSLVSEVSTHMDWSDEIMKTESHSIFVIWIDMVFIMKWFEVYHNASRRDLKEYHEELLFDKIRLTNGDQPIWLGQPQKWDRA